MGLIRDNPRFKKDCEKYNRAIKDCKDTAVKKELTSLYDQFLKLTNSLDQSFNNLIVERIHSGILLEDIKHNLQIVRQKLETLIK